MLKQAKQALLWTAGKLSIQRGCRDSAWRGGRLLILCYHGLSLGDEHQWDADLYMDLPRFRARMEMLRQGGYTVLPLGEATERLRTGSLPPRAVAITFDDGDYDFAAAAWPVLREYGYPATVYVTTFYVDHHRPIFRLFCSYLLWKGQGRPLQSAFPVELPAGRANALLAIEDHVRRHQLPLAARDELAEQLAKAVGVDYGEFLRSRVLQLMRPEELAQVAREGADVQLHSHRHRVPPDRSLFVREIDDNRRRLQEITGRRATHFCYPSGVTQPDFLPWLRECSVDTATTCVPGLAAKDTDPLLLPRLIDHCHLSPIEFESWLTGFGDYLPRRAG